MSRTLRVTLAGAFFSLLAALLPGQATASPSSTPVAGPGDVTIQEHITKTCAPWRCDQSFSFPGGTVSIDVDTDGVGDGTWIIFNSGNDRFCETGFRLEAPAQSWTCNIPAGNYRLFVVANTGLGSINWISMGIRW